ncbi:MAG: hypothetical protein F9K32_05410 [Desulfobulbaceae bacterium]|nr:MAG: hypothetical protein F9K32_05410 [Desulfobulbaceae bacterium]
MKAKPCENILGLAMGSEQSRLRQQLVAASMGMVTTHVLGVCVQLKICDLLRDEPLAISELARVTGTQPEPLRELLIILASLDVVTIEEEAVALKPSGRLLLADQTGNVVQWVQYAAEFCAPAWMELADVLLGIPPAAGSKRRIYDALSSKRYPAEIFHGAMQDTQVEISATLAEAIRLNPGEVVADLGAGQSSFLIELLMRYPNTSAIAFDRFSDFTAMKQLAHAQGVAGRLQTIRGSFLDPLPFRVDVIVFKNVLADWSMEHLKRILTMARQGLNPDGRMYIATTFVHDPPSPDEAVVSLNLRVLTEGGDRSEVDYVAIAKEAGFELTRQERVAAIMILEFSLKGTA